VVVSGVSPSDVVKGRNTVNIPPDSAPDQLHLFEYGSRRGEEWGELVRSTLARQQHSVCPGLNQHANVEPTMGFGLAGTHVQGRHQTRLHGSAAYIRSILELFLCCFVHAQSHASYC
jgi:hypothetical protein